MAIDLNDMLATFLDSVVAEKKKEPDEIIRPRAIYVSEVGGDGVAVLSLFELNELPTQYRPQLPSIIASCWRELKKIIPGHVLVAIVFIGEVDVNHFEGDYHVDQMGILLAPKTRIQRSLIVTLSTPDNMAGYLAYVRKDGDCYYVQEPIFHESINVFGADTFFPAEH